MKRIVSSDDFTKTYAFIPSGHTRASHEEMAANMVSVFLKKEKKLIIVIVNGTHKEFRIMNEKTGEVDRVIPINSIIRDYAKKVLKLDITDIKDINDEDVELRDCLSAIANNKDYVDYSIVITGNKCVSRGITIQTSESSLAAQLNPNAVSHSFKLDIGIFSTKHGKVDETLLQILGRLFGTTKHVNKNCTIYLPSHVLEKAKKLYQIQLENVKKMATGEDVIDGDWGKNPKDPCIRKDPIIIEIDETTRENIQTYSSAKKRKEIGKIIEKNDKDLYNEIICGEWSCDQVLTPGTGKSRGKKSDPYARNVLPFYTNNKFYVGVSPRNIKKNCYTVVIDYKKNNLIIQRWYGSYHR